tara:strand:- start:979 stop:1794 length:816 start_codon:yes stop_codon:yes gene_type:complete
MNIVINKKYKIIEELGEGSFGKIYIGKNINTSEKVAIKLQYNDQCALLRNEAAVYNLLKNIKGVPKLKSFGKENEINYMVIELLGGTIERLSDNNVNFALTIGLKLINIIKEVHKHGIIHRDIKPENILYSLKTKNEIYLIDYGLSICYIIDDHHIQERNNRKLLGSIMYISRHIHDGTTPSRRDDIISIVYIILYLIDGNLPWKNIVYQRDTIDVIYKKVSKIKSNLNIEKYYGNRIPNSIYEMYYYCDSLKFNEEPKYDYLCSLLKSII